MYNINYADDNVKKSRTFAESFRELAQAARKPRIICRSAIYIQFLQGFLKKAIGNILKYQNEHEHELNTNCTLGSTKGLLGWLRGIQGQSGTR